jgi:hypothetical protein
MSPELAIEPTDSVVREDVRRSGRVRPRVDAHDAGKREGAPELWRAKVVGNEIGDRPCDELLEKVRIPQGESRAKSVENVGGGRSRIGS